MRVVVLAGGVGAARFLNGLTEVVDPSAVTAIVNVADDDIVGGLAVSPDLDTITYTCAGAIDHERGWGLRDEHWRAMEEMRRLATAAGRTDIGWFNLGDRDLGTHMYRSTRLREGATLTEVTAEIVSAWGLEMQLLPVTNDRVATIVSTEHGELTFQEYFRPASPRHQRHRGAVRRCRCRPGGPRRARGHRGRRRHRHRPLEPHRVDRAPSWPSRGSVRP